MALTHFCSTCDWNISGRCHGVGPIGVELPVSRWPEIGNPSTEGCANHSDVTAVNTGVSLDSPRGSSTVTPAVGDVIVKFTRTAGIYDAAVSCFYHGEVNA